MTFRLLEMRNFSGAKMVVVSTLRPTSVAAKCLWAPLRRALTESKGKATPLTVCVRHMGGGARKMDIRHSTYQWTEFKNDMHFFTLLGLVPMAITVFCANVFGGKYELADIPEGYEPELHEYYKHPISRFMAKYLMEKPERSYEMNLHVLEIKQKKIEADLMEERVRELIEARNDYKAWYYLPVNAHKVYKAREEEDRVEDRRGSSL